MAAALQQHRARSGSLCLVGGRACELLWYRLGEDASGAWERCLGCLDDSEQSLVLYRAVDGGGLGEALLVAGLHEASVDVVRDAGALPCPAVGSPSLEGRAAVQLGLRRDGGGALVLQVRFEEPGRLVAWVAALKRASFPPGRLWAARAGGSGEQRIDEYAMSRLGCAKAGSVWKAESAKVSMLVDSLRLCARNSLADQMASSPESALLLLRLKAFGCTLSIDRVLAEMPEAADECDELLATTLRELLDFCSCCAQGGSALYRRLDETAFADLVEMVALKLVRPIVGATAATGGAGEALPAALVGPPPAAAAAAARLGEGSEAAWVHQALLYELLLKLVGSNCADLEVKKRCVSEALCRDFVQLFRAKDPREREYVKTVTHCMYSRLVTHRGVMRAAIAHAFQDLAFASRAHGGAAELLEVVGSIASGFAKPIKGEHKTLLLRCLLPLHGVRGSEAFAEQLSFVVMQYINKEPELSVPVVQALLRYWPRRSAAKQILFLGELGEIVSFMDAKGFQEVQPALVRQLCDCICAPHFQVAEYAMGLLNNSSIYAMIFEDASARRKVLPALLLALRRAARGWNASVRQIAVDIIDFLRTLDLDFFLECERQCAQREHDRARRASAAADMESALLELLADGAEPGPDLDARLALGLSKGAAPAGGAAAAGSAAAKLADTDYLRVDAADELEASGGEDGDNSNELDLTDSEDASDGSEEKGVDDEFAADVEILHTLPDPATELETEGQEQNQLQPQGPALQSQPHQQQPQPKLRPERSDAEDREEEPRNDSAATSSKVPPQSPTKPDGYMSKKQTPQSSPRAIPSPSSKAKQPLLHEQHKAVLASPRKSSKLPGGGGLKAAGTRVEGVAVAVTGNQADDADHGAQPASQLSQNDDPVLSSRESPRAASLSIKRT